MSDNPLQQFHKFSDLLEGLKNGTQFERGDMWGCRKGRIIKSVMRNRLRKYWLNKGIKFERPTERYYTGTVKDVYLDSFDYIIFVTENLHREYSTIGKPPSGKTEILVFEISYGHLTCTNSFQLWKVEPCDIEIYI